MLDEPLGALDRPWRERLPSSCARCSHAARLPSIYVTHDHTKAPSPIGDQLVVMRAGKIEQMGTPDEVVAHPVNAFVAAFVGVR